MENKKHRQLEGVVVSDKMKKTVVVEITRLKEHPRYKKRIRMSKRFKVHDENNDCRMGDIVVIEETRPLSKEKRWRIKEILKRANILTEASTEAEIGA